MIAQCDRRVAVVSSEVKRGNKHSPCAYGCLRQIAMYKPRACVDTLPEGDQRHIAERVGAKSNICAEGK